MNVVGGRRRGIFFSSYFSFDEMIMISKKEKEKEKEEKKRRKKKRQRKNARTGTAKLKTVGTEHTGGIGPASPEETKWFRVTRHIHIRGVRVNVKIITGEFCVNLV